MMLARVPRHLQALKHFDYWVELFWVNKHLVFTIEVCKSCEFKTKDCGFELNTWIGVGA